MNPSLATDPSLRSLDACGCCEGLTIEAPLEIRNRPGLAALAARIGTHSRFKSSALSRLSSRDFPHLQTLRTRDEEDFAIAFLDAWAVLADVLTFYQERFANETYLRTASERRSLRELARLIGYELRPGVAASAPLAFVIEDAAGAPAEAPIAGGIRVQSIPGPGQTPQTFETIEAITGRPEWNAIQPGLRQRQEIATDMQRVLVSGLSANVPAGATILIVAGAGSSDRETKRVVSSSIDAVAGTTNILLVDNPPDPPPLLFFRLPLRSFEIAPLKLTTTYVRNEVIQKTWSHADLLAQARVQKWLFSGLKLNLKWQTLRLLPPVEKGVFVFRQKAAVFGHNAPKYLSLPPAQRIGEKVKDKTGADLTVEPVYPTNWDNRTLQDEIGTGDPFIYLDATYSGIVPGSLAAIEAPSAHAILRIDAVSDISRSDFTLSAKVTRLKFTHLSGASLSAFSLRSTTVHIESEKLPLAELPVTDPISSAPLSLDGAYPELATGQRIVLSGEPVDLAGVRLSEALTIASASLMDGFTWLTFTAGPVQTYVRSTVAINANVALATHGELAEEVLGSGDARQPFQKFTLRQPPLTYVPAKNTSGALSTLEIRVNDLLWHETPSLFQAGPEEHVFITRPTEEGRTIVQFGDGQHGARVPTGQENIRARYRKGMGAGGLVEAGQLSLLQGRPLGVRGVGNPIAASGMADRETIDEARTNAPLTVLTLDRIVSLRDYGDFARAFSGIAKALALLAWSSAGRRVFVTVAGTDGAAIEETSTLYSNLLGATRAAGDPQVPLHVKTYTPAFFTFSGKVICAADRLEEKVFAEVESRLRTAFGFAARDFLQTVARSEVIAVLHATPGVVAVDLDTFHRIDRPASLETELAANPPRAGVSSDLGAELLLLDARPLDLAIMKASA